MLLHKWPNANPSSQAYALSKIHDFRAGIFCISNRVKEGRGASEEQWTGAAPLWSRLLHPPGGRAVRALLKVWFCPREHLCKESSRRSFSFERQSCTCSVQMHHLQQAFILASQQCQRGRESGTWSRLLQRQQPSHFLRFPWRHLLWPPAAHGNADVSPRV